MKEPAWEGPTSLYTILLGLCAALLYVQAFVSSRRKSVEKAVSFANTPPAFIDFQRRFLCVFFLSSVTEGMQAVYGEALYEYYGLARRQIALLLLIAYASSLFIGTFLGASADYIGRKRACVLYGLFQLLGSLTKHSSNFYVLCLANVFHGLAVSLFSCAFEAWLTAEHERLGFRQEWLSRTFWVMIFGSGVSAIGTGALASWLSDRHGFGIVAPSTVAAVTATGCMFLVLNIWGENVGSYETSFSKSLSNAFQTLKDKKALLLGWTQACFDLSVSIFWFLWTPTLVADGREVHSGRIYAYLMASLMLGSVISALLLCGPLFARPESFLPFVYVVASLSLIVPAYDYQDIGVLVASFCVFHVCIGITLPSLASLRSIYIQNDRRAGVLSLYHVPVNMAILFVMIKGGLLKQLDNSFIFYICAASLISGAVSLHVLSKCHRVVPSSEELFLAFNRRQ